MGISKGCALWSPSCVLIDTSHHVQANVLIYVEKGQPSARLCDFGLSKITEGGPSGLTTSSFNRKGTLRWFSPELMCDAPKRNLMSDVWAWGCIVLEVHIRYDSSGRTLTHRQSLRCIIDDDEPTTAQ